MRSLVLVALAPVLAAQTLIFDSSYKGTYPFWRGQVLSLTTKDNKYTAGIVMGEGTMLVGAPNTGLRGVSVLVKCRGKTKSFESHPMGMTAAVPFKVPCSAREILSIEVRLDIEPGKSK